MSKVVRAQERPAWYTMIGTAVHQMIEDQISPRAHVFTNGSDLKAEDYFYPLVRKAMEIEPDTDQWMFSTASDGPLVKERALQHVKDCFERAVDFLEDIEVWEVEFDASGYLSGFDVEIRAFIDVIGEHKKHGPVIVDWKTGKTKDRFQLDTYAALLRERRHSEDASYSSIDLKGYFAMLHPEAPQSRYTDLSKVNPEEVAKKYQETYSGAAARLYKATNVEQVCGFCFHKLNCLERSPGTERAVYYDRSSEDGFPF